MDYKAGQFMFVTLSIGELKMQKPFSISSSPTEEGYVEFTKRLTGHPFSNRLDGLRVGDMVEIDAPYGNFTFGGEFGRIAMLSGGVGITPLRSICKFCSDEELHTEITLLYGNHTEEDIIFREEFGEMQKRHANFRVVFTVTEPKANWGGYRGNIDAEMIRKEIPDYSGVVFYVCGPPTMVQTVEDVLRTLGVKEENIKKENFSGYQ